MQLEWTWLCVPYAVCSLSLVACAVAAAVVRGDRVLRLGTIGAATTALPWALCSGISTCTSDPELATRLLRLGNGPIALVGPSLLLVLLGVAGQLERHRWLARLAGAVGLVFLALCWGTDWVVSGVHELPSGILYINPGPLTQVHFTQIGLWLAVGIVIARRATSGPDRRRMLWMLIGVLTLGTAGASDLLLAYDIAGVFPIAWLCATIAALVALYYELRTDLLRPQGFDRDVFIELISFLVGIAIVAVLVLALEGATPVAIAIAGSVVWVITLGVAWSKARAQPAPVARERALEEFVAAIGEIDRDARIGQQLTELWKQIAIHVRAVSRVDGDRLVDVETTATRPLGKQVMAWLVEHGELLAAADLGTMKVGPIRPKLEVLVAANSSTLIVPLIDRGTLVGMVEAEHGKALREDEHGLVAQSARAAARAITYVALARSASRERETAREVEVAEAMRLHASASRDDELGRWTVAAEYRSAARTTGAGWSASLLADGRLAVLVTEAQAHGVAAALATAALTGAFSAATATNAPIELDDLLTSLGASADGVIRGGEPVAAFVAILDAEARTIAWACAGHPGGAVIGPVAHDMAAFPAGSVTGPRPAMVMLRGGGERLESRMNVATRGEATFAEDALLVIASSGVQGDDEARFQAAIREQAPAGARLASVLVEAAAKLGPASEDLLAVIVRQRSVRRSEPVLRR